MNKLHKIISKYTGNLCFAASKDDGDYLLYAARDGSILYAPSPAMVEGLCLQDLNSKIDYFIVTHGTNFISQFADGVIIPSYMDAGPNNLFDIVKGNGNEYFAIDKTNSVLVKFKNDGSIGLPSYLKLWSFDINGFDFSNNGILYRGSNRTILINDGNNLQVIRDDINKGVLISTLEIPGSGNSIVISGGEFNPEYTYLRYKAVYGEELAQSSTSSASTSSSYSSESSSNSSSSP